MRHQLVVLAVRGEAYLGHQHQRQHRGVCMAHVSQVQWRGGKGASAAGAGKHSVEQTLSSSRLGP